MTKIVANDIFNHLRQVAKWAINGCKYFGEQ